MDPHIKEWKEIKERFQYMKDTNHNQSIKDQLAFRIECINNLIISSGNCRCCYDSATTSTSYFGRNKDLVRSNGC